MRCLGVITFILILSSLLPFSHLRAGELYLWTDTDGVIHITDTRRALPHGDDVETIRYREENDERRGQPKRTGDVPEEKSAINSLTDDQVSRAKETLRQEKWESELKRAREEYEQAKVLVEKRRRYHIRQSDKHSRDRYEHALTQLAEKREQVRALQKKR